MNTNIVDIHKSYKIESDFASFGVVTVEIWILESEATDKKIQFEL